jgi:hypothetical protein
MQISTSEGVFQAMISSWMLNAPDAGVGLKLGD